MLTKTCAISGKEFVITDDDLKFYEKMGVPAPTLCPEERQRRRLTFRNERTMYRRKCDGTGKLVISIYHQETPFPVYSQDYWWSDNWSGTDQSRDFDFSRPFFEQFKELYHAVPQIALWNHTSENSQYNNCCFYNKNCYMNINTDHCEDSYFNYISDGGTNLVDCTATLKSELCYECVDCVNCYESVYLQNSKNCSTSYFLKDCIGCNNCFGCVNLRNKEYHFLNEPLSQAEYEAKIKELDLESFAQLQNLREKFQEFVLKFPHRYMQGEQNENVSGDYIQNGRNVSESFDITEGEDLKFCTYGLKLKNVMDSYALFGVSNSYECMSGGFELNDSRFILWTSRGPHSSNYCISCVNDCKNCFGCVGLKKKEYCILNKQYSPEEYEKLVEKIVAHMKKTGEWGEFFPSSLSPFGYNETIAQEYFPLTKEDALQKGYRWRDEEASSKYVGEEYNIPDKISDAPEDICEKILTCQKTGKNYKIQPAELKFYQTMKLPIPRLHPDTRHEARMKLRNPRQLWKRECANSGKEIWTTYSPDRPEKILCEEEYLKIVN